MTKRYSSRKFILASAALLLSAYLVYGKHISDGVYSAIVISCVGAYITGNVVQKKVDKSQQST